MKSQKITLRSLSQADDLSKIHELYTEAFPECERKPFDVMTAAIGHGLDMLSIERGDFSGLAIVLTHENVALLDYFAVAPNLRGMGIGEDSLELLKQKYPDNALLIEIEDPDDECDNSEIRHRRLGFYKRCKMVEMPYTVNFYGTKMLVLTSGSPVTFDEHIAVYKNVLGDDVAQNITLYK